MNAENVGEILDALAVRFGSTGAHLWEVLQRQALVDFVTGLMLLAIGGLGAWGAVLARRRAEEDFDWEVPTILAAVLTGFILLGAVICLFNGVGGLMNPEYYALQKVLGAFK